MLLHKRLEFVREDFMSTKIFIIHSSLDHDLVLKLVRTLEAAFVIANEQIRCTSLAG